MVTSTRVISGSFKGHHIRYKYAVLWYNCLCRTVSCNKSSSRYKGSLHLSTSPGYRYHFLSSKMSSIRENVTSRLSTETNHIFMKHDMVAREPLHTSYLHASSSICYEALSSVCFVKRFLECKHYVFGDLVNWDWKSSNKKNRILLYPCALWNWCDRQKFPFFKCTFL